MTVIGNTIGAGVIILGLLNATGLVKFDDGRGSYSGNDYEYLEY